MQYRGKAWKIIKCPNCLKYFKSDYMKQYHLDNAKVLCPMYNATTELLDPANHPD
jgi:hypothetical protein